MCIRDSCPSALDTHVASVPQFVNKMIDAQSNRFVIKPSHVFQQALHCGVGQWITRSRKVAIPLVSQDRLGKACAHLGRKWTAAVTQPSELHSVSYTHLRAH